MNKLKKIQNLKALIRAKKISKKKALVQLRAILEKKELDSLSEIDAYICEINKIDFFEKDKAFFRTRTEQLNGSNSKILQGLLLSDEELQKQKLNYEKLVE